MVNVKNNLTVPASSYDSSEISVEIGSSVPPTFGQILRLIGLNRLEAQSDLFGTSYGVSIVVDLSD